LAKRFFDLAADHDPTARLPRSVAVILLSSHKYLQDMFGADEIDRFARLARPYADSFFSLVHQMMMWLQALDLVKQLSSITGSPTVMRRPVSLGGALTEFR
jgi:hypothetical protein